MQTIAEIRRREFLKQTTAVAGLATLFEGFGAPSGLGAEAGPATTAKSKDAIDKLMADLELKGGQFLSVPRKDGQFLNLLIKATRAKNVLEVGTSNGYAAIWITLGLEETGGKFTTIEIRPERVKLAKDNLGQAGLTQRVTFMEGDAHKIVPTLEGPFDFVFLDADKEGTMDYFQKLFPKKLAPGAMLVVHNAIRQRDAMSDFLDAMAKHPDFDAVILSVTMEDGFSLNYRHRQ